jgi:signal transduction histidine kinase
MEIVDEGIGIEEENLETIFNPFFRTEKGRTRSSAGVGLGLTLARRIIEAHGGTIHLTSTVGKGTTLHLRMPHNSPSRQNNTTLS